MDKTIVIQVRFSTRTLARSLILLAAAALPRELGSESLTLQTYYPSPLGIYSQVTSTGETILARDGGNVGVGTTNPKSPTPSGSTSGNIDVNDIWVRSANGGAGTWLSGVKLQCKSRYSNKSTKGPCGFLSQVSCNAGEIAVSGGMYGGGNDALQTSAPLVNAGQPVGWSIVALDTLSCGENVIPDGTVATGNPPTQGYMHGAAVAVCCTMP